MTDILITDATVISMDPERRVIDHGAVAINGGRIVEIGDNDEVTARHQAARVIDGRDMVVMPGLIDCHGHAGHGPGHRHVEAVSQLRVVRQCLRPSVSYIDVR